MVLDGGRGRSKKRHEGREERQRLSVGGLVESTAGGR
jgi:hypothetical protein